MPDSKKPSNKDGNPNDSLEGYFESLSSLGEANQKLMQSWMSGFAGNFATPDSGETMPPLPETEKLVSANMALMAGYQQLLMGLSNQMLNQKSSPVIEPDPADRRFRDPEWTENPVFSFLKQSYLLNARWATAMAGALEGQDADTAMKIDFYTRQMVDAWSPTNFAMTNPEVLRAIKETNGANLSQGLKNLTQDMQQGSGSPMIRQTDMDAFTVGENLAVTEGSVVYQNELMQLIQYAPKTAKVRKRPLLIIPPWINKFYILDLQPENSFVSWLAEQGYTVFLISWVNPDERHRDKGLADYMKEGIFEALDAIEKATGEKDVNAIGYCIGGTLLAITLGYMAAKKDTRIKAATYLAAQIDFSEAGELRVFTDEDQLTSLSSQINEKGYLDGSAMAWTFNMLRSNDLIWSFVVNNYLLGKDPKPFDLLYWNADSTRMPAAMLLEYLRGMYQQNLLSKPGGLVIDGVPIDLSKVKTPSFFQATKEDHIAPYPSVFKAMNIFSGPNQFALAGSGHIAGIVNHPAREKYQFWTNSSRKKYETADEWLADATETAGSWWPAWHKWHVRKSGTLVKARKPGDGKLPIIEAAPGSYVLVKESS